MRLIALSGMMLVASVCHSQKDSTRVKTVSHYLGIQANELLRQLFNLSNNSSSVVNPYLINYSLNSVKSGWGLNVGLGYTVDNVDQSDANTSSKTQSNNLAFRIGVERKVPLTKKWLISYGIDLLADKNHSTTTTTSQFQFNTNETDIDNTTKDSGFGPRFTMNYFISPKIILGTEASYYYKSINTFQKITNSSTVITVDPNTGQQTESFNSSSTNTSQDRKQFHFSVPAIIYLILKF